MAALPPGQLGLRPKHLALLRSLLERHLPQAECGAYDSHVGGDRHEASDLNLVVRSPAFSPGYQILGFQPGGGREAGRFSHEALKGRDVTT